MAEPKSPTGASGSPLPPRKASGKRAPKRRTQVSGKYDPGTPGATSPAPPVPPADADLLARAYRKVMAKEALSAPERTALKRHERDKEERLRWQFYRSIPQKHWRAMSGRQAKVINEQAERYGLPLGGPTVNLPALARALHDFLAENALKLAQDDDDPLLRGGGSPALEQYRVERTALARLDRLEREGILRSAGDALGRQHGPAATDLLYEALDDAAREVERSFGAGDDGDDGDGVVGGGDGADVADPDPADGRDDVT